MPDAKRRILIVDDHVVVRQGLRRLIEDEPTLTVCGEAEGASEVLFVVGEEHPDLVLLDITLGGGLSGIEIAKQLHTHYPELPVLVLSMHDETLYAERALQAGARGYVMKRASGGELTKAIGAVLEGHVYVSDVIKEQLSPLQGSATDEGPAPLDRLSSRELEVFQWLGRGCPPRHIANVLHLSVKTVETHRRNIRQKLCLEDATTLSRYAVRWYKDQAHL